MNALFDGFLDEKGQIRLQPGFTLVDYVEQHSRVNADELAYRNIGYSRERDGEGLELTWEKFGVPPSVATVSRFLLRRGSTTSFRSSPPSRPVPSPCRSSIRTSPGTPTVFTLFSVTASRLRF